MTSTNTVTLIKYCPKDQPGFLDALAKLGKHSAPEVRMSFCVVT
jgi:hypothetical protein